ncbi:hypothetical protein [Streptomyces sparsogenes]|uniref:hypothetical protein n=1 Tax=Streptomyces sparsogenes TaxID=67365 RepID=UPI00340C2E3B
MSSSLLTTSSARTSNAASSTSIFRALSVEIDDPSTTVMGTQDFVPHDARPPTVPSAFSQQVDTSSSNTVSIRDIHF